MKKLLIMVFLMGMPLMLWPQDTMYVHQDGGVVTKFAVSKVDSIVFFSEPALMDIEGNIYRTVTIGGQVWMAENLRTTRYSDGADIEYPGSDLAAWSANTSGAYGWYGNEIFYKDLYGAIYNWYAVNSGKLCPVGWRIPNDLEWSLLTDYIIESNDSVDESNIGNALRSCRQVDSPLGGDCATILHPRWNTYTQYGIDVYGFSALPGGSRENTGYFYELGETAKFWSLSSYNEISAWIRKIEGNQAVIQRSWLNKSYGLSVRCIKN